MTFFAGNMLRLLLYLSYVVLDVVLCLKCASRGHVFRGQADVKAEGTISHLLLGRRTSFGQYKLHNKGTKWKIFFHHQ